MCTLLPGAGYSMSLDTTGTSFSSTCTVTLPGAGWGFVVTKVRRSTGVPVVAKVGAEMVISGHTAMGVKTGQCIRTCIVTGQRNGRIRTCIVAMEDQGVYCNRMGIRTGIVVQWEDQDMYHSNEMIRIGRVL